MIGFLYFSGLAICSLTVGHAVGQLVGWGVLGGGLIFASCVVFVRSTFQTS